VRKKAKHIFLLFVSTVFVIVTFAQTKNEQIKLIREKSGIINKDTTLKKVILENEEFLEEMTDHGGTLVGYYKIGEIKKIYESIGLSNGITIREFYFDNGQLIFVYEKFESFVFDDKKGEFDFSQTKTIFEGRYYFSNEKLFNKSTKGDKSLVTLYESTEGTLLGRAKDVIESLNKNAN